MIEAIIASIALDTIPTVFPISVVPNHNSRSGSDNNSNDTAMPQLKVVEVTDRRIKLEEAVDNNDDDAEVGSEGHESIFRKRISPTMKSNKKRQRQRRSEEDEEEEAANASFSSSYFSLPAPSSSRSSSSYYGDAEALIKNAVANVADKLMCCSSVYYSSSSWEQALSEVPDVEYDQEISLASIVCDSQDEQEQDYLVACNKERKGGELIAVVAAAAEDARQHGQSPLRKDAFRSTNFVFLEPFKDKNNKNAPGSPYGERTDASSVTASTASMNSKSWASGMNTLPSRHSVSMSFDDSLLSLPSNMSAADDAVPSSTSMMPKMRPFDTSERYWTDPTEAERELVRKVQFDSLAHLPYLAATEGYRC